MTQDVLLRKQSMLDDLPRFYDESPEVDGILQAEATEIERIRAEARLLLNQLSAVTATFGLSDWERVLALPENKSLSVNNRRARILAKIRGTAPATVANILSVINSYVPNRDAYIEELPTDGTFSVIIPLQDNVLISEIIRDLQTYKPAHLEFMVALLVQIHMINVNVKSWEFPVNYPITNMFTTSDVDANLTSIGVGITSNSYELEIPSRITNLFSTEESAAITTIDTEISSKVDVYTAPFTRLGEINLGGGLRIGGSIADDAQEILVSTDRVILEERESDFEVLYNRVNNNLRLGEVEL